MRMKPDGSPGFEAASIMADRCGKMQTWCSESAIMFRLPPLAPAVKRPTAILVLVEADA